MPKGAYEGEMLRQRHCVHENNQSAVDGFPTLTLEGLRGEGETPPTADYICGPAGKWFEPKEQE